MCCRFIQFLEGQGARLTFAVQPALASVMKTLESAAELITVGEDLKGIDLHVPLMSLAHMTYQWVHAPAPSISGCHLVQNNWTKELGSVQTCVWDSCAAAIQALSDAVRSLNMATAWMPCLMAQSIICYRKIFVRQILRQSRDVRISSVMIAILLTLLIPLHCAVSWTLWSVSYSVCI